MSQPGFESLRKFILHEIAMMASEYAQAFFKQEEKEGPRDSGTGSKDFRVRQVGIKVDNRDRDGALLGPLLILPEPVHVKLVLLSPHMALMINLNRRLYASCVPNRTPSIC